MKPPGIYVTLDRDELTAGRQLSIMKRDENGGGHGYRIAGPTFTGRSQEIMAKRLTVHDRDEIRRYLDMIEDESAAAPAPPSQDEVAPTVDLDLLEALHAAARRRPTRR